MRRNTSAREKDKAIVIVMYLQINHCGQRIKQLMDSRRAARRNRRGNETRYCRCKFKDGGDDDSFSKEGWVKSIGDNIISYSKRLGRLINITLCSF